MAQSFAVDAMADTGRQVPFDRHFQRRETLGRLEQRLRRNEIVTVAVNQQHWRA